MVNDCHQPFVRYPLHVNATGIATLVAHDRGGGALVPRLISQRPECPAQAVKSAIDHAGRGAEQREFLGNPILVRAPAVVNPRQTVGANEQQVRRVGGQGRQRPARFRPQRDLAGNARLRTPPVQPRAGDGGLGDRGKVEISKSAVEGEQDHCPQIGAGRLQQLADIGGRIETRAAIGFVQPEFVAAGQPEPRAVNRQLAGAEHGADRDGQLGAAAGGMMFNAAEEFREVGCAQPPSLHIANALNQPVAGVGVIAERARAKIARLNLGPALGDIRFEHLADGEACAGRGRVAKLLKSFLENGIGFRARRRILHRANPAGTAGDGLVPAAPALRQPVAGATHGHLPFPYARDYAQGGFHSEKSGVFAPAGDCLQIRYSAVRIRPRPVAKNHGKTGGKSDFWWAGAAVFYSRFLSKNVSLFPDFVRHVLCAVLRAGRAA